MLLKFIKYGAISLGIQVVILFFYLYIAFEVINSEITISMIFALPIIYFPGLLLAALGSGSVNYSDSLFVGIPLGMLFYSALISFIILIISHIRSIKKSPCK